MKTFTPWSLEALVNREKVFDGLIEKAVRMTLRPLVANVEGLLTAAAGEFNISDLASSMIGPTVSMDSAGRIEVSWNRFVETELAPFLEDTMADGAAAVRRAVGIEMPGVSAQTVADNVESAKSRLKDIGNFVWLAVRGQLADGVRAGENLTQLAARVRKVSGVTAGRAATIARTEIHRAAEAGALMQVQQSGLTDAQCVKTWKAREDERTRPWHMQADGQSVGIFQPFEVGGEYLQMPGDPNGRADNIVNCRCTMEFTFLTDDDEDNDEYMLASGAPSSILYTFHLPGKHDQRSHGNRKAKAAQGVPQVPTKAKKAASGTLKTAKPALSVEDEARAQQARVDDARKHAKVLADLEEGIINKMSAGGTESALTARLRTEGLDGTPLAKEIIKAGTSNDLAALNRLIERLAKQHGLTRIGGKVGDPDQMVRYDRVKHDTGGEVPETGYVAITKPGFEVETPKGRKVLFKAVAAALSPEEVDSINAGGGWGLDTLRASTWTEQDEKLHPRDNQGRFRKKNEGSGLIDDRKAHPTMEPIPLYVTPKIPLRDILPLVNKDTADPPDLPLDNTRQLKQIFRADFSNGFSTTVSEMKWGRGDARFSVEGKVLNKKGKEVGDFTRVFKVKKDGTFAVEHEYLLLDKEVQGQGFAQEFNKRAFEGYQRMGVQQVELQADIDVGGYAWARAGYDWLNDDVVSLAEMHDRIGDGRVAQTTEPPPRTKQQVADGFWPLSHNLYKIPAERREEQAALVQKLWLDIGRTVDMDTPDDELANIIEMWPTPYELSELGRWPGAGKDDMWIGKAILMNSNWMGVKYLEDSLVSA